MQFTSSHNFESVFSWKKYPKHFYSGFGCIAADYSTHQDKTFVASWWIYPTLDRFLNNKFVYPNTF